MATVEAAALKGLDRTLASGTHYNSTRLPLPSIAGGDGVARLDDGRLVYANAQPGQGMMAEKTLINPAAAVELPKGIDPVFAAAVPNPTLSAWLSFEHRARMQEGQHVLVLGHRYYVVAEALTNAAKHAVASEVRIRARNTVDSLSLSISDDGVGGADSGKGSGLIGVKDRIEVLGGRMQVGSPPGSGTILDITIPHERCGR